MPEPYAPYVYTDEDWEVLLESILHQRCLPFLSAGACYGAVPLGGQIAETWAQEYDYPLADRTALQRVSQFLAIKRDPMWVKDQILSRWFTSLPDPSPD